LLDHLVFALAGASRGNLQGAQKAILQVDSGFPFHGAILTEK
jgi:hypothetical protein